MPALAIESVALQDPAILSQEPKRNRLNRAIAQATPDIFARPLSQFVQIVFRVFVNSVVAYAAFWSIHVRRVSQANGPALAKELEELFLHRLDDPVIRKRLINSWPLAMPVSTGG